MSQTFLVEVVLATRGQQEVERVVVHGGDDVATVLGRCTLLSRFAHIEAGDLVPAIYGRRVDAEHRVEPGDRIELLRPLRVEPREARRRRAARRGR